MKNCRAMKNILSQFSTASWFLQRARLIIKDESRDTAKEPINPNDGWQVIQIEDVRPAEKFPAYDAIKVQYLAALTAERSANYANELAEKAVEKGFAFFESDYSSDSNNV